jgi:hypothetical protein
VIEDGPALNIKWVPVVTTPSKSLGKRSVTPGPRGPKVAFPVITPPLSPPHNALPPQLGLHPPAAAPSGAAIQQAVLAFLQGSSSPAPLPPSVNPGMAHPLPTLHVPSSEWLTPMNQPVYDLAIFLPLSSSTQKPKVAAPKDWFLRHTSLGRPWQLTPTPTSSHGLSSWCMWR